MSTARVSPRNYRSATNFLPYANFGSSGSSSVLKPVDEEEQISLESLICRKPFTSTNDKFNQGSDSLFDDFLDNLCLETGKNIPFNYLEKTASDVNSELSSVLLNYEDVNELTEGNSSDKENESLNISFADLCVKGKKKKGPQVLQNCRKEAEKFESDFENSLQALLSNCATTDNALIYSVEVPPKNGFQDSESVIFDEKDSEDLSFLINNLDIVEQTESLPQDECEEVKLDLTVLKKSVNESPVLCPAPIPGKENRGIPDCLRHISDNELFEGKPSLFCKVLCCKVKRTNPSTLPKFPKTLPDLLIDLDYYKHFSFDTPSPDDIIKQKQKNAFKKKH